MLPPIPMVKKVCVVGPPGVGKTAYIERFAAGNWRHEHVPTLAPKVTRTEMTLPLADRIQEVLVQVMVWDFPQNPLGGQRQGAKLRGAAGMLLLTRADTPHPLARLTALREWALTYAPKAAFVGVLSQADRAELGPGVFSRLREAAAAKGLPLMTASARTGDGVRATFLRMGELLVADPPV